MESSRLSPERSRRLLLLALCTFAVFAMLPSLIVRRARSMNFGSTVSATQLDAISCKTTLADIVNASTRAGIIVHGTSPSTPMGSALLPCVAALTRCHRKHPRISTKQISRSKKPTLRVKRMGWEAGFTSSLSMGRTSLTSEPLSSSCKEDSSAVPVCGLNLQIKSKNCTLVFVVWS